MTGKYVKAADWLLRSVISPRQVDTTPWFPFTKPITACTMTACHKVRENPKETKQAAVSKVPVNMTGFLPMRSDKAPQAKLVHSCASAKAEAIVPTYTPTCAGFTSGNVDAISGKYGLIEFNAVCSHRAMKAKQAICLLGRGEAWCSSSWFPSDTSEELLFDSERGCPLDLGGDMPPKV